MEVLHAVVESQHEADLLEAADGEARRRWAARRRAVQVFQDARAQRAIVRIAREELARLARDLGIGVPVVVVGAAGERRQAAGDEDLAQSLADAADR